MLTGRLFSWIAGDSGVAVERSLGYGPHPRHRLDVYRPVSQSERQPILIFYYGGGWTSGERSTYGFVGAALAARGFTTIIPDYRLFPEVQFPGFVEDAARAYAWVARNLAVSSAAARPIALIGHSAGAHIAALLALDRGYLAELAQPAAGPAAWVGLAGPYAIDPTTWPTTRMIFAGRASSPETTRPIAFARPAAPPTLLVHGAADTVVKLRNTREFAAALRALGNHVEVLEPAGLGHIGAVLALSRPFRWRIDILGAATDFIARCGEPQVP